MGKTINAETGMWNNSANTHQVIVVHDTESGGAKGSLAYMQSTQGGSYQDLVDLNGDVYLMVPDNKQAWSAMNSGNRVGLHVCATGYASWTREQWLSHPLMLESIAVIISAWSVKFGIPLIRVNGSQVHAGVKGVCGHADISAAFRESDHTDPGSNFPMDWVINRARQMLGSDFDASTIIAFKRVFMSAIKSDTADSRAQLSTLWPQLGGRTFSDGLAAVFTAIEGGSL